MRIDIWSDIACPWCHIGLARFERVLESFPHRDQVEVRMRSFQLDPTLPESYEGTETEYLAARKGVSEDVIGQMFGHVAQAAQSEGLPLDFDSVRVANSWRAHRLLHAAEAHDPSGALTRRLERALFEAHFRDGESISDPAVLLRLASELGIPDDVARPRPARAPRPCLPPRRRVRTSSTSPSRRTSPRRAPWGSRACRSSCSPGNTASAAPSRPRCSRVR